MAFEDGHKYAAAHLPILEDGFSVVLQRVLQRPSSGGRCCSKWVTRLSLENSLLAAESKRKGQEVDRLSADYEHLRAHSD